MSDRNAQQTLPQDANARPGKARKVLAFTLNGEDYAVDIAQAKEVLEVPCITKVPYVPDFVKGAMNLRGEIISVLDIRPFCGLPPGKRTEQAKVLVTDAAGSQIGILVDQVRGTMEFDPDQVQAPLSTLEERIQCHVVGQVRLKDHIVVWLDFRSILQSESVTRLRGMTG